MDVVKNICDQVAVISGGKLIEQGSVSEIFAHPQMDVTKEFIASSLKINIPVEYLERLSSNKEAEKKPLLKLEFTGQSADDPVLSEVSRLFQLDNNIIYAQIEYAGGVKFGAMVIEVSGTEENHQKAIEFYNQKQIRVEVLGYV